MDVYMAMPHDAAVSAGPHRRDDDRARVGGEPVRRSSGAAPSPRAPSASPSAGRDATLIVWSPDYDGKGKAWVRYDDGTDAIVGGSAVSR